MSEPFDYENEEEEEDEQEDEQVLRCPRSCCRR